MPEQVPDLCVASLTPACTAVFCAKAGLTRLPRLRIARSWRDLPIPSFEMLRLPVFAISRSHVAMRSTTEKHDVFPGGPVRRFLTPPRARDTTDVKICSSKPHLWPHIWLDLVGILQNRTSKLCTAVFWHPPTPRSRHARTSARLLRGILDRSVYSGVWCKSCIDSTSKAADR